MEQDRASPLLPHYPELARKTADGSGRHRRVDRRHHNEVGPEGRVRTRYADLQERHQGHRRRNGKTGDNWRRLPPRMELHRQPQTTRLKRSSYFSAYPKGYTQADICSEGLAIWTLSHITSASDDRIWLGLLRPYGCCGDRARAAKTFFGSPANGRPARARHKEPEAMGEPRGIQSRRGVCLG